MIKIDTWMRRTPLTDRETVGTRIGRLPGKYPADALHIGSRLEATQKAHRQKEACLLRINCEETDPALLRK